MATVVQKMRAGASLRPKIHTVAQKMLLEKGGGTQNTNRPSEMRPKMHTVVQKMLLEKGGGTQNVYRS